MYYHRSRLSNHGCYPYMSLRTKFKCLILILAFYSSKSRIKEVVF